MAENSSFLGFLEEHVQSEAPLAIAEVVAETISGAGYNLKAVGGKGKYYLHGAKKGVVLARGQLLAVTYSESRRAPGRLDVEAFLAIPPDADIGLEILQRLEEKTLSFLALLDDDQFGQLVLENLRKIAPQGVDDYASFVSRLPPEVQSKMLSNVEPKLVPSFLNCELSEELLIDFTLQHPLQVDEKLGSQLSKYAKKRRYSSAKVLLALLTGSEDAVKWSGTVEKRLLKFVDIDAPVFCDFLRYCTNDTSKESSIAVVDALGAHENLGKKIADWLGTSLPMQRTAFSEYLACWPEHLQQWIVNLIPAGDPRLLDCLDYQLAEPKIVSLISSEVSYFRSVEGSSDLTAIGTYARNNGYLQTSLLVDLINDATRNSRLSLSGLKLKLDNLMYALFEQCSTTRQRIQAHILQACDAPGRNLSFCEGKLWRTRPQEPERAPELKALCRRKDCKACPILDFAAKSEAVYQQSKPAPLLSVVESLFGITPAEFHTSEPLLRSMAGLNRWNEICERLHCDDCEKPLTLSEHPNNSIGKMAYGATYWHCGNSDCISYCSSIKLTHCVGCGNVIDSRVDSRSCTPHEVRSYKKFYICSNCASCCKQHNGISGRCPKCGEKDAYSNVTPEQRTHAKCKSCDFEVSIDKFGYERIRQRFQVRKDETTSPLGRSSLVMPRAALAEGETGLFVHDLGWELPVLYVYDLHFCLSRGLVNEKQLEDYQYVHDLKVMWRLVTLGLRHERYGAATSTFPSVTELDIDFAKDGLGANESQRFVKWINDLFDLMYQNELWNHYNEVELPFIHALSSLLQGGITISEDELATVIDLTERSRNVLIESLRQKGIDSLTETALLEYVSETYEVADAETVIAAIQSQRYDFLKENDALLMSLSQIGKLERVGGLISNVAAKGPRLLPEYQIVGAETGRCTSRSPNILGFPKELRPIVKARPGWGIIECDYSQMEVGILAALAEDTQLIDDFNSGDVYARFAENLGRSRDEGKLVFLAILYGVGRSTLAGWLGCKVDEVDNIIASLHRRYPRIEPYQKSLLTEGHQQGYVSTVTGLKRFINRKAVLEIEQNQALMNWQNNWIKNFPVQANAAVVFKNAITDLANSCWESEFKLIAPVYDAIVFEAQQPRLEHYTNTVSAAMKRAMVNLFPVLNPQISINNYDPSCWNGGEGKPRFAEWAASLISGSR